MGKVGSTSVNHALVKHGFDPIHAHWAIREGGEFPTTKKKIIQDIVDGDSPSYSVVTLVREPFSRNKSAFFQQLQKYEPDYRHKTAKKLFDVFVEKYNHKWGDLWFEQELMTAFNINPFESFNKEKGYKIYSDDKHNILIIRLEDTKNKLEQALYELIGIKGISMLSKNTMNERHDGTFIGKLYDEFREFSMADSLVDTYRNLRYGRVFYGDIYGK